MCEECEEKETFDVMINVRPCTMTRQGHFVSCESCKICLWEERLSLCCLSGLFKINVLRFVPRNILSFVKTERFLPLLVRALFFNEP